MLTFDQYLVSVCEKFEKFSVTVANFSYDSAKDEIEICDYLTKTCIKKGYSEFE